MEKMFCEIKIFQVKPDKTEVFEELVKSMELDQKNSKGCLSISYMKRFYTIDGIELGSAPRELTKVIKSVKYFSTWMFDSKENYGVAIKTFFDSFYKEVSKFLIAPFDIQLGFTL